MSSAAFLKARAVATAVRAFSRSKRERMYFAYRVGRDAEWSWVPQQFDASILSDEATAPGAPNFTGAFVGMACQDMAGTARHADFDYFEYAERDDRIGPFMPSGVRS